MKSFMRIADSSARSKAYEQPAAFANAYAQNFGTLGGTLAGLGNAYTNAYGAYGAGLGNVATAMANERSNFYNSNALAEQARQNSLANIGAASIGAYGSAANSALGAWAANQQAYNQAASSMHGANQRAMADYGMSRNNAMGQYGSALAGGLGQAAASAGQMAGALGAASRIDSRLANMGGSMGGLGGIGGGGGGFSASGLGGPVASGSFGRLSLGGGSGGGIGLNAVVDASAGPGSMFGGIADRGFGSVNAAMSGMLGTQGNFYGNLMSPDIPNRLDYGAEAGRKQIDDQHYTSRGMPSQMMDQALSGLMGLNTLNADRIGAGMNQYYGVATDPRNRADYSGVLGGLGSGFNSVGGMIGGMRGDVNRGFNSTQGMTRDLWNQSMQPVFDRDTPDSLGAIQRAEQARQAQRQISQTIAQEQAADQAAKAAASQAARQAALNAPMMSREQAMERARLRTQYQNLQNSLGLGFYDVSDPRVAAQRAGTGWDAAQLGRRLQAMG
jgi:hypothetical protein